MHCSFRHHKFSACKLISLGIRRSGERNTTLILYVALYLAMFWKGKEEFENIDGMKTQNLLIVLYVFVAAFLI